MRQAERRQIRISHIFSNMTLPFTVFIVTRPLRRTPYTSSRGVGGASPEVTAGARASI
jgi:hypothetical protein